MKTQDNTRESLIKRFSYFQNGSIDLTNTYGVYMKTKGMFSYPYGVKSIQIKESKNGNKYCSLILTEVKLSKFYMSNADAKNANILNFQQIIDFINENEFGCAYKRINTERTGSEFCGWILEPDKEGITSLNI